MRTMIARWIARRELQDANAEVWREVVYEIKGGSYTRYKIISCNGSGYICFDGWRWYMLISIHP